MKTIQKIIVWYFLIGAIVSFCIYAFIQPEGNFFLFLMPNLIAVIVFIIYIVICSLYLKNFDEGVYKSLFLIMLVLQSMQLRLNGYVFVNYYLPEATLLINLKDSETIKFTGSFYKIAIANGYFKDNKTLQIGINFIGIIMLFISSVKYTAEK